jgi:hypothetical protein
MASVKVGGNVDTMNCTIANLPAIGVSDVKIAGNFSCSNNSGGCVLAFSSVEGNVKINDNAGDSVAAGNTIGSNLNCQGNEDISDGGQANKVGGHKHGQCADF